MVLMKQRKRKRAGLISSSIAITHCILKFAIPLVIGIFIGSFTNYMNMNMDMDMNTRIHTHTHSHTPQDFEKEILSLTNQASQPNNSNSNSNSKRDQSIISTMNDENSGWHPIYVYYGKSSEGLKSSQAPLMLQSNSKPGSQVKQDEIIMKLIDAYHRHKTKEVKNNTHVGTNNDINTKTKTSNSIHQHRPYFVDLAANDATSLSNTYRLEQNGWEGLCIEPNPVYWFRLSHRKCIVAGAFVGGKDDMQIVNVSLENKEFGGIVGDQFDNTNHNDQSSSSSSSSSNTITGIGSSQSSSSSSSQKRFTISIQTMFTQFNVPKTIDYLSLDVEGAEELVMNDFPFDTNTIRFITIERPKLGLQALLKEKKYMFVMQLVSWGETLWVHESVMNDLSMEYMIDIVSRTKVHSRRVKKGQDYFDMKTGSIVTK